MSALFETPYFGIGVTIAAYWVGVKINKKTGLVICNNMLITVGLIIILLKVLHISYDAYYAGGSIINMLLGPATTCMAVSIYAKKDLLKRYWAPVLAGCLAGAVASIASVLVMCRIFGLDRAVLMSLLPKSVTTPIATAVAESHGGIVPITVAAVIVTGMLGNILAPIQIGRAHV